MSRSRKTEGQECFSPFFRGARQWGLIRLSGKVERMCRVSSDLCFDVELMAFSPTVQQRVFRHFTQAH
jgi:hypothetical protein